MDNVEPVCMPYKLLSEITDGFSDKRIVGRGTYGVVYKGEDKDAQVFAVKILKIFEGVKNDDFHREFNNLAKLRHENIVQLLGFCNETENEVVEHNGKQVCAERIHRALCFKYMPNGSLHEHLYDADLGFGWSKRYRIIKGICEGSKYLHMGSRPMYHLDLKPRNILLDDNMVPKIADFGLSRLVLGEENTSKETISVVGTCGYMPPEYINHQIISKEFDIFSLGVIIIKIMMGSAGYFLISDMEPDKFIEHVCNKWKERLQVSGRPYTLIILQVNKCIKIALKCIEMHRKSRPTIEFIVHQLSETEKHTNYSLSSMEEFDDCKSIPPKSNDLERRYQEISHEASIHISMEKKLQLITEFPREPKLHFVEDITGNFANEREIGKGSFGVVYKGVLQNGEVVAVKRLLGFPEINLDKQFANEVLSLIDLNHRNIVKLIGYCYETKRKLVESHGRYVFADTAERILCYEYLPTGSLDKYLYGASHELNWNISFKIIQGICQGLQFLHELQRPIIHMDLKPGNILLDDNLMPKIADFGLSRLFGEEQTRTLTSNVVGARGYMAPEYYYRGEVSAKSDIYSLGILIIEIVTGLKVDSNTEDLSSKNLIDNVQKTWTKIASKYPTLEASSLQQVKRCIDVGLNCVSENPKERPSIGKIMEELNGSGFSSSS